ncbi:GNAT family N-acetyltransferase [Dethiothermospora halolimnae]|uniref:GNAT family N-acetyltransferase n=1 Tax=Dethiothermospora halolimnae TaxID=3114390 RepID=UPI003CCC3C5D
MGKIQGDLFQLEGYSVKKLNIEEDLDNLQLLCEKCSDYHQLAEGKPTSTTAAKELFNDLPNNKTHEDKIVIGIYDGSNLIAVIDNLIDFPNKGTWFLGLLMIAPKYRNNGLGEKIYKKYRHWVFDNGSKTIRLGVLYENHKALKFWQRIGLDIIRKVKGYKTGNRMTSVYIMSDKLEGETDKNDKKNN